MTAVSALAVAIPLLIGECRLEQAVVTHVPPTTVHVITISECGAIKCWTRWIEYEGKRLAESRVCTGEAGKFEAAP